MEQPNNFWVDMNKYLTPINEVEIKEKEKHNEAIENAKYYLNECCLELDKANARDLVKELDSFMSVIDDLRES